MEKSTFALILDVLFAILLFPFYAVAYIAGMLISPFYVGFLNGLKFCEDDLH